jgi:hypothetical protein
MPKTNPEEAVMRYFQTQPLHKAEVMLSVVKSVVKQRSLTPVNASEKTYLSTSEPKKKFKKNHHAETVGLYNLSQGIADAQNTPPGPTGPNPHGLSGNAGIYPLPPLQDLAYLQAKLKEEAESILASTEKKKGTANMMKKPDPDEIPF